MSIFDGNVSMHITMYHWCRGHSGHHWCTGRLGVIEPTFGALTSLLFECCLNLLVTFNLALLEQNPQIFTGTSP